MRKSFVATLIIETEEGNFLARYSDSGLAQLDFPNSKKVPALSETTAQIRRWHSATTRAVHNALCGKAPGVLPPLDLLSGTPLQKKVWAALQKIPCGKTETYSQIAASVGKPKAARAAGSACGANPIPLLIPCHRVVAASGKLGGFSGGLDWKKKLLAREK